MTSQQYTARPWSARGSDEILDAHQVGDFTGGGGDEAEGLSGGLVGGFLIGELEQAADGEAQDGDLAGETGFEGGFDLRRGEGAELPGVEAVFEGVFVARLCTALAFSGLELFIAPAFYKCQGKGDTTLVFEL